MLIRIFCLFLSLFFGILYGQLVEPSPPKLMNAIQSAFPQVKENIQLKELKGGMTSSKLYYFEVTGNEYVLRVFSYKQTIESREKEIKGHQIAANMGIAPKLIHIDRDFIVMPFIRGHTLTKKDFENEAVLEQLGAVLKKLHSYKGVFPEKRTQNDRVRKHFERATNKGIAFPTVYQDLYEEFIAEGEILDLEHQVLCHADLNPGNILLSNDGQLYLIDWTSITCGNLYTDLGYLTFVNGFSDEQAKGLLSAYLGRMPNQEEWAQLNLAKKRTSFLTATVWFDFSESEDDKLIDLPERVAHLDSLLSSKELKLGEEYIFNGEIISPLSGQHETIKLIALGFLKTYMHHG